MDVSTFEKSYSLFFPRSLNTIRIEKKNRKIKEPGKKKSRFFVIPPLEDIRIEISFVEVRERRVEVYNSFVRVP